MTNFVIVASHQAGLAAAQHLARTLIADDFALLVDHAPPRDRRDRPSGDVKAFPGRVVGAVVQIGLPDRLPELRVPQHDVGIEADADRALARIEPVDAWRGWSRSAPRTVCSVIRPFETPSENRIGSRVSTPGMPFGTQRNEVRAFGVSLPLGSS